MGLKYFSLFLKLGHIQVGSPRSFGSGSYACMALVRFPLFPCFFPFSGKCLQRVGLLGVKEEGGCHDDHLMLSEIAVLFSLFIFGFFSKPESQHSLSYSSGYLFIFFKNVFILN